MKPDFPRLRLGRPACAVLAAVLLVGGTLACEAAPAAPPSAAIPMKKDGGVYVVPVSVDGLVTVTCIVDSGASDVNIPTDAFRKLVRAGLVQRSDFLGTQDYTLADGSSDTGRTYRIKFLKVGNVVVRNVVVSVGGDSESGLLGQSFLERFGSWSVDNHSHALMLFGAPSAGPAIPVAVNTKPVEGPPDATTVAQTSDDGALEGQSRTAAPSHPTDPADDDRLTSQNSQ